MKLDDSKLQLQQDISPTTSLPQNHKLSKTSSYIQIKHRSISRISKKSQEDEEEEEERWRKVPVILLI